MDWRTPQSTDAPGGRSASQLNEHQRRHILATCEYIDRLLTDLETAITAAASGLPFARYHDDLTPEHKMLLCEQAAAVRGQMLRMLHGQGISTGRAASSLRHTVRTSLGFIDIALEEMKPQYMRGYGDMPSAAVPELNGLASELQTLVQKLDAALAPGAAADPGTDKAVVHDAGNGIGVSRPGHPVSDPHRAIGSARPDLTLVETQLRHAAGAIAEVRAICERAGNSWHTIAGEALDLAAETASKALDWPDDAPRGIDEVVREAVTKVGSDHTEDIRLAVANLMTRLRATLASTSRALGWPEPAGPKGWADLMREMPSFLAPVLRVNLRLFLRRALGPSSAHARVRRALEAQVGDQVGQTLARHGALLHEWSSRVVSGAEQYFEAQASAYRAQAPDDFDHG